MNNVKFKCFLAAILAATFCSGCSYAKDFSTESSFLSTEDSAISAEDSSVSEDDSSVSAEDSTVSEEDSAVSAEDSTVSEEDSTVSEKDSAVSAEDSAVSEEDSSVSEKDSAVSEKDSSGSEEDSSGSEEDSSVSEEDQTVTGDIDNNSEQPESSKPRTPDFAFDTEFTAELGREYCVGRDGIFVTVDSIEYYETTGYSAIVYNMTIDGTTYTGNWGKFPDGNIINQSQNEFSANALNVYGTSTDAKTATISISSEYKVKEPKTLSGNYSDTYSFSEPWYIESDNVIIFIDKDIEIHGDIMNRVLETMRIIEQETGLSYSGDPRFKKGIRYNLEVIFGEAFTGVDHNMEKFHVYIKEDNSPHASSCYIAITSRDVDFNEDVAVIVHELTHAVHLRNYVNVGNKLTEGLATYMTDRIISRYPDKMTCPYKIEGNYSYYAEVITADNSEYLFITEPQDDFDNYLYGYRFVHFLFAEYGDNIFRDIASHITEHISLPPSGIPDTAEVVDAIKTCTTDDIFVEFALWLSAHEDMFDGI